MQDSPLSSKGAESIISKNDFKCRLIRLQKSFPLCLRPFETSFSQRGRQHFWIVFKRGCNCGWHGVQRTLSGSVPEPTHTFPWLNHIFVLIWRHPRAWKSQTSDIGLKDASRLSESFWCFVLQEMEYLTSLQEKHYETAPQFVEAVFFLQVAEPLPIFKSVRRRRSIVNKILVDGI